MDNLVTFNFRSLAKSMAIAVMVVVLLTQSTVQAQSAGMASNELKNLITKMKTEVERRTGLTDNAFKALQGSNAISSSAKNAISTALTSNKNALSDFTKQLTDIKDLNVAKQLAGKIDDQYNQFASATATSFTLKDSDVQQQAFAQLGNVAKDAQSLIDTAGASGQDVSALQEQIKGIDQLVQSIGAIIASIVTLIMSLATGNFSQAAAIFQTIIGQLSQNLTSIGTAQNGLGSVVDSLNNIQLLKTGGAPDISKE